MSGVNVMGVPDIESFVKPGELLLMTVYALRDDPKRLPALVRTLDELKLAPGALGTAHRVPDDPKPRHETPLFQTAGIQAD